METANAHHHLPLLLNLLALQHLIKEDCEPFGNPERNPRNIKWTQYAPRETDVSLGKMKSIIIKPGLANIALYLVYFVFRDSPKLYSDLKPLFLIDPLLLPMFVYLCPSTEYETLFKVIPPFYSVARLAHMYSNSSYCTNVSNLCDSV